MKPTYLRDDVSSLLGHAVEECGEVLAALGKTQRWGLDSSNPELPQERRETNRAWIVRELADLEFAVSRLRTFIAPASWMFAWRQSASMTPAELRSSLMASIRDGDVLREAASRAEAERDEARSALSEARVALSNVSGALVDTGTIAVGPASEFGLRVRDLTAERDTLRTLLRDAAPSLHARCRALLADISTIGKPLHEELPDATKRASEIAVISRTIRAVDAALEVKDG